MVRPRNRNRGKKGEKADASQEVETNYATEAGKALKKFNRMR